MSHETLKIHLTTEKSALMKEESNKYVFRVDKDASKSAIKEAVEKAFKVKVESVNTLVMPGKSKRLRFKSGRTAKWKKAIIKLEAGQVISDFENI